MPDTRQIAIADDDDSVRTALGRLCSAHGLVVHMFGCAQQLIDTLQGGARPDCLVLDVQMPGVGGIDVQAWLRQHRVDIPTVMITGRDDEQVRLRSLALGASAYFCKPVDVTVLLGAIQHAIRTR